MSEEVRSSSIPDPAANDGQAADSVEPPSLEIEFTTADIEPTEGATPISVLPSTTLPAAPPAATPGEPEASPVDAALPPPAVSPPAVSPPAALPGVSHAPFELSSQLRPQLSSELSPAKPSERPPPPSQRAAHLRIEVEPSAAAGDGPMLPPAASLSSDIAPVAARRFSEPVPLALPKAVALPPPSRGSSLPPGLVEPKRIIQVLGSNVPVLDSAWEEDAIEDLDDSEAYELSETPLPDAGQDSEPELEVSVTVEDFPPSVDVPIDTDTGDDADLPSNGGLDGASAEPEADGSDRDASGEPFVDDPESPAGKRTKAPPNKRRRPLPPSARGEKPKLEPPSPVGVRKWWEEMFSEEFLRAIPILSPRQLEREVNFIDDALGVARGGRILDLACGAGQHAVELAARGYDLVGFDLSQSQLDWAGGLAQERGQSLQFTYGDMRDLSYVESFDAVYSWNTSFGFFEEEKNCEVAQRVFKALRPGGRFLLDVTNRDFIVAQQPGQTWFEGDGCVCIDDVSIDFITSRMKVKRTLMLTNGKNRECNYSLRIYGLHELGKILHDVGFKILNVSGRPEMPGVFFGSTSPRIIILASRP